MKKIILFSVIGIVLCAVFLGNFVFRLETASWQTVSLDDTITVKLPEHWQLVEEGGLIYVLNENEEPVMIESYRGRELSSNKYVSDYYCNNYWKQVHVNDSVEYGIVTVIHADEFKELWYLDLYFDEKDNLFVVWDTSVNERTVANIAKTYYDSDWN